MFERNRGYLPHRENALSTYFITFRLADTLPKQVLESIKSEYSRLQNIAKANARTMTLSDAQKLKYLEMRKIQECLDNGYGECWLKHENIARIVIRSVQHFDGVRYSSHACCIMPNHIHWLMTPLADEKTTSSPLIRILHSIKSYTANEANKILNRSGAFWSREYYDHLVKNDEQFGRILKYILENPLKAGLCKDWREWKWTIYSDSIRIALGTP